MSRRFRMAGYVLASLLLAAVFAAGQTPKPAAKTWTPPHTPDGQPDLEGIWTSATLTPLERPADLAGKPTLTEKEAEEYEKQLKKQNNRDRRDGSADADLGRAYNEFWYDRGNKVVGTRRTSLIVDPPDGLIPALTPEAQKRAEAAREHARLHAFDGPEDRPLAERCLSWATAGPPMLPSAYNNNYHIVQTPGYVTILSEMIHDVRIIPLDGRPHLGGTVRQWMGDARGHWEGNTLVVDTMDFNGKAPFRGSGQKLHLVERFTRVDRETMLYEFTVDDPTTFTRSWTAQIPMTKTEGPIYEYACQEGNYALRGVLAGARAEEKVTEPRP
jgi:hypothetical protein